MKFDHLLVANWKMNPESPDTARAVFLAIRRASLKTKRTETVVCPPAIYMSALSKLATSKVKIGAQNTFWENAGSYTGEIAAPMVFSSGGTHVIVGHSERRMLGETDDIVNKKLIAALRADLKVILCIGEKERDGQGNYLAFVKDQLLSALAGIQKRNVSNLIIAYEPVWAIGKSDYEAMSGADMYEMLLYIRKIFSEVLGRDYAETIPILYGGSVSPINAEDIMSGGHVNGLLVGRQSLDPIQFKEIMRIVDGVKTN